MWVWRNWNLKQSCKGDYCLDFVQEFGLRSTLSWIWSVFGSYLWKTGSSTDDLLYKGCLADCPVPHHHHLASHHGVHLSLINVNTMDEGTIKTQNPKCRLYWCLINFIDWRYSQSCWYFRPLLWTVAPLPSLLPPPPLPKVNEQYILTVCGCGLWGGGGGLLSYAVGHNLQEFNTQNLQNCYNTTNKNISKDDI